MTGINCKWVEDHLDEYLSGGRSQSERASVELHLTDCDSCIESVKIWSFLRNEAPTAEIQPMDPITERRVLSGEDPEPANLGEKTWQRKAILGLTAAAVIAIALGVFGPLESKKEQLSPGNSSGKSQKLLADQTPAVTVEGAGVDDWIVVEADGRRVIPVLPGTALWLGDDAEVTIASIDDSVTRFRLEKGFAVAEIGPVVPGFRFIVETPEKEIEARGTVFSVNVSPGGTDVRVAAGEVEVRDERSIKRAKVLIAGQMLASQDEEPVIAHEKCIVHDLALVLPDEDTVPPEVQESVEEPEIEKVAKHNTRDGGVHESKEDGPPQLLKLAQNFRRTRAYAAAAETYEQLVEEYPDSNQAVIALVALGQLKLSALRQPEAALAMFDEYLSRSPSGDLSGAALSGRVRAFAEMNRHKDVIEACDRYLKSNSSSGASAEVFRRRGEARAALGDLQGAARDFQYVILQWPDSSEATRSKSGLDDLGSMP